MALTYVDPNFDSDVSFDIADAVAVKGGAVDADDVFWVVNGAVMTGESSFACLKINLGTTSGGAAGALARYGLLSLSAGGTATFTGNATATNSGVLCNPTSADASSKDSKLTIAGTSGSWVIATNSVNASNTSYKYELRMAYGSIDVQYYNQKFTGSGLYFRSNSSFAPLGIKIRNCKFTEAGSVTVLAGSTAASDCDVPFYAHDLEFEPIANNAYTIFDFGRVTFIAGSEDYIRIGNYSVLNTSYTGCYIRVYGCITTATKSIYNGMVRVNEDDTAFSTWIVPTSPAAVDAGTNGSLLISWDNLASYNAIDKIYVYNNADDTLLGVLDATTDAGGLGAGKGSGYICDLTNELEYTMYLKASSDSYFFSDETSTFTGTPTAGTVPTFTGAFTASKHADFDFIDIDISGCTIANADKIEIYIRAGDTPTTADSTYLAGIGDPAEGTIFCCREPDGTPLENTSYTIKLLARNSAGGTTNANSATVTPYGYLALV